MRFSFVLLQETLMLISMTITLSAVAASRPDIIRAPLEIISFDDITPEERRQIAQFEEEIYRPKRYCFILIVIYLNESL